MFRPRNVLIGSLAASSAFIYQYDFAAKRHLSTGLTVARIVVDYKLAKFWNQEDYSPTHLNSAKRLLALFMQNGGVYIKIGQHMASLIYLLPEEYTTTMQVLQNQAFPSKLEDVKKVFKAETGMELENYCQSLNPTPIGVASLAQVYQGISFNGTPIAIKVQHHYLDKHAPIDIKTCVYLSKIVRKIFPEFEFDWLAEEMEANLPLELDFVNEAKNANRARNNFKNSKVSVVIPEVFMASRRVLVMKFEQGSKINDLNEIKIAGINPSKVSLRLSNLYSEMIFKHQFLHSDPHPGNVLIRAKFSMWTKVFNFFGITRRDAPFDIVLLDHGLYRSLNDKFVLQYAKFWTSIFSRNEDLMKKYCMELLNHKELQWNGIDFQRLLSSMLTGRPWSSLQTEDGFMSPRLLGEKDIVQRNISTMKFIQAITFILRKLPREMLLVLKTSDLIRSIDQGLAVDMSKAHLALLASGFGKACIIKILWNCRVADVGVAEGYELLKLYLLFSGLELVFK